MAVLRMGYVHAKVTDLEEAKQHYGSTLGLYETRSEPGRVFYKGWDEWDHHSVVLEEAASDWPRSATRSPTPATSRSTRSGPSSSAARCSG